jgi:hypothetical protein
MLDNQKPLHLEYTLKKLALILSLKFVDRLVKLIIIIIIIIIFTTLGNTLWPQR